MLKKSNASRKERHVFTMDDLRGVDLSSSKFDVAPNRALDMRNFIKENGVTQKRRGWREEFRVPEGVVGLYFYDRDGHRALLAVSEKGIYRILDPFREGTFPEPEQLTSFKEGTTKSAQFFFLAGRCYILTSLGMYIYGESEKKYALTKATEDDDSYIPVTTRCYNTEEGLYAWRKESFEPVNLLNRWRRNVIVGCDWGDDWVCRGELDAELIWKELDYGYFPLKVVCQNGEVYTTDDMDRNLAGSLLGTEFFYESEDFVGERAEKLKYLRGSYIKLDGSEHDLIGIHSDDENMVKLYGTEEFLENRKWDSGYVDLYGLKKIGEYKYSENVSPARMIIVEERGRNDILEMTLEFVPAGYESRAHLITDCSFGILYGTEGTNDRLFLSGNPAEPNMIRFSEPDDFTYFPDNNALIIGSADVPINAFSRLTDAALAVFKKKNAYESTIYYLTGGTLKSIYDEDGEFLRAEAQFPTVAGTIGEGCVTNAANCNFSGDSIILSDGGVYGLTLVSNLTTNIRYAKERSYSIARALREHDLTGAIGTSFGGRYYLFVDGKCYVADAGYKYYRETDADDSYNYEWWVWDNIPATCVRVIDDGLWFGTADGRICVFDGEYSDRTRQRLYGGDVTVSDGGLIVSESLLKKIYEETDGYTFCAERELYAYGLTVYTASDGNVYVKDYGEDESEDESEYEYGIIIFTEKMTVYDKNLTPYEIEEIDRGEGRIVFKGPHPVGETDLYFDIKGRELKVQKAEGEIFDEDGDGFTPCVYLLADGFASRRLHLVSLGNGVSGHFTKYQPIVAEWQTAFLDLGSNIQSKTVEQLTVSCESGGAGKLTVIWETRKEKGEILARSSGNFSLDNFSFDSFTFETGFATTHTVRKTIRDFNYIRFTFQSESSHALSLHGMSAVYKFNRLLRGVK